MPLPAVLIVACPCAAGTVCTVYPGLGHQFAGSRKAVSEKTERLLSIFPGIDTIVFDKTGTLTEREKGEVQFVGRDLSDEELRSVVLLLHENTHPLGRQVFRHVHKTGGSVAGWPACCVPGDYG